MDNKKPWKSKTLWTNLIMAGLAFFPGPAQWVSENPSILMFAFAGVNMGLRLITKDSVGLK